MQETDEDKEGKLPRQEIWQREDEESLTPIDIEVEEGQELDTNQEASAGYVMEETDVHPDSGDLDEESTDEMISIGTNPDEVMNQIDEFTSDPEVLEDFSERQELNIGSDQLLEKLIEHHSTKPALSAGDIDAAWEDTDVSGEESVDGSVATPDQDIVEEIGEALGVEYTDDEPLHTEEKLNRRDRDRWELDPASASDQLGEWEFDEDDLSSELDKEFSEVEGEFTAFRSRNTDLEAGWQDFYDDEDEEGDFEEFQDEMDEDFIELLDEMEEED